MASDLASAVMIYYAHKLVPIFYNRDKTQVQMIYSLIIDQFTYKCFISYSTVLSRFVFDN